MIYLLYGPDSFRARQKLAAIRAKFLATQPEFNLTYVASHDIASPEALDRLIASSTLLGGKRLVIITDLLATGDSSIKEAFAVWAKRGLPDDVTTILYEGLDFDKRQSLFKLLNQPNTAQHFELLTGTPLLLVARDMAATKQLAIDDELLRRVITFVGSDLWRLDHELTKLAHYAAAQPLTSEVITNLIPASLSDNIFALMDAIAHRDPRAANRLMADLIQRGEDPIGLLAILAFQLRSLILVKSLSEQRKSSADIIKQTGLHPYAVSNSLKQASQFQTTWLIAAYQRLVQMDWKIKTGELASADALDHFLTTLALAAI